MRTAAICPTCATYINALCVIYNGPNLLNINTLTLDNLQVILGKINTTVGGINTSITGINTSITTINSSISTLTANLALKEDSANKSNDITLSANSSVLFPTQHAVKAYADGLVAGLLDDRGNYTPSPTSPGAYPSTGGSGTGGAIMKGDIWFIDANGYLGTTAVVIGASVRALVDNPTTAADWDILDANLGIIPEDVANKVTTAADITTYASSTVKYPAVKAIKDYVDNLVSTTVNVLDLAAVLNIGNTATNQSITINGTLSGASVKMFASGSHPYFKASTTSKYVQIYDDRIVAYDATSNTNVVINNEEILFTTINGGYNTIKPNVNGDDIELLIPNVVDSYTIPISVNGVVADSLGNITLPTNNVFTEKIHVTSSEVLALASVPKLLVAAQGAGTIIRLMDASIYYNYGTTGFSSTQLRISVGTTSVCANAVLALSTSGVGFSFVPNINLTAAQSVNQGLYLNTLLNPTSGDGSLDVYVTYQVITL